MPTRSRSAAVWLAILLILVAARLPSLAQPAAADQSLYAYAGQQLMAGHAPYAAAWDQKPPGIHVLYGILWAIWPNEAVIGAADTVAAAVVAGLLVVLGRQLASANAGALAAAIFLLLGHPSMRRLSGVFVRGQCETFIGLCVVAALTLALATRAGRSHLFGAGVLLGLAVWLKYNAIVYVVPLVLCLTIGRDAAARRSGIVVTLAGLIAVGGIGLAWVVAHGALADLRLATFAYNVDYSADTYGGPLSVVAHLVRIPLRHAQFDLLWFFGGVGVLVGLAWSRTRRASIVAAAWIGAAIVSIAINGARDLPQYFVQAWPALAFAAGVGFTGAWQSRRVPYRVVLALALVAGFWRVGIDRPVWSVRLGGLPGLVENIRVDLDYIRGRIDRATYLDQFGGQRDQDKFVASDVAALAELARTSTTTSDTILVFGFSPGIYVQGERQSASRFFWSRPVVINFADGHPGYGVNAFLGELHANRPALVVLQRQDWGPAEPNSEAFFLATPALAEWLRAGYTLERSERLYSIWRRSP